MKYMRQSEDQECVFITARSMSHIFVRTRPTAFPAVLVDALVTWVGWGGVGWGNNVRGASCSDACCCVV